METVLDRSKDYEYIVTKHDPAYEDIVKSIELVKKFIVDNKLIIYGGSAIDYALRLKGDNIYSDETLAVPDLDFYSPDNVEHSYQIADILYRAGWENARAINALHTETQRVDVMDNHFIADITYVPKEIFDTLPFLEYNGMRIIHPLFQRLDMHSSLSFPYDNPPQEVIFSRWSKDLKRFNKLVDKYPLEPPGEKSLKTQPITIPIKSLSNIPTGFLAYALLYNIWCKKMKDLGSPIEGVYPANITITNTNVTFDSYDIAEFVHFAPSQCAKLMNLNKITEYEIFGNLLPERIEGTLENTSIHIYSTRNRLLSINSITINDLKMRIVNVQYLLRHFLALYFFHKKTKDRLADACLLRYRSLLKMIHLYEIAIKDRDDIKDHMDFPLMLSIVTYGKENINIASEVALNRLYADIDKIEQIKTPANYYPGRSIPKHMPHPVFNPRDCIFFHKSGLAIAANEQPEQTEKSEQIDKNGGYESMSGFEFKYIRSNGCMI